MHVDPVSHLADKARLLAFLQSMSPMPRAQAEIIAAHFTPKQFSKGDLLIREGKLCNDYYFLDSGFVRSFTYDVQGREVTTGFFPEGGVVLDVYAFFNRLPAREDFEALTDCNAWWIDFEGLNHIFHAMPEFREFGRSVLVYYYSKLKLNMLSVLQDTAEVRYAKLLEHHPEIFQHAPLKHIASFLGITDTSLSRIRKEFAKSSNAG